MSSVATGWKVQLARTLWFNIYRARIEDEAGKQIALLRLIPAMPLDRAEVPPDAPTVAPYLLVLVEDTVFPPEALVEFESSAAELLLASVTRPDFAPEFCQFTYPSLPVGSYGEL